MVPFFDIFFVNKVELAIWYLWWFIGWLCNYYKLQRLYIWIMENTVSYQAIVKPTS